MALAMLTCQGVHALIRESFTKPERPHALQAAVVLEGHTAEQPSRLCKNKSYTRKYVGFIFMAFVAGFGVVVPEEQLLQTGAACCVTTKACVAATHQHCGEPERPWVFRYFIKYGFTVK